MIFTTTQVNHFFTATWLGHRHLKPRRSKTERLPLALTPPDPSHMQITTKKTEHIHSPSSTPYWDERQQYLRSHSRGELEATVSPRTTNLGPHLVHFAFSVDLVCPFLYLRFVLTGHSGQDRILGPLASISRGPASLPVSCWNDFRPA